MQASEFSTRKKAPGRIWPPSLFPRETQRAAHSCLWWWMGRVKDILCAPYFRFPHTRGRGDHPRLGDHTLIENARRDRPSCLNIDLVRGPSALILGRAEAPGSLSWRDEGNNKARHGPVNGMRRTLCPGAGYGMTCMRIQIAPALPDARGARLIETAACAVGLVPNKDAMGGGIPPSPTVEF